MGGVVLQGMCGGGTYIAGVCVVGDHAPWERAWMIGACVVGVGGGDGGFCGP